MSPSPSHAHNSSAHSQESRQASTHIPLDSDHTHTTISRLAHTEASDETIIASLASAAPAYQDDDSVSVSSSRSDKSEEAAGLVSRLSNEQDRAQRRAKYEGPGRGRAIRAHTRTSIGSDAWSHDDEADPQYDTVQDMSDNLFRERVAPVHDDVSTLTRTPRQSLLIKAWTISREALPTLFFSLLTLVFSGELLVHLARWPVFSKVDKLFILIPILLNLKGNIEGNLSLRLSTSANIGELDVRRTRQTLIYGNLALLQVQALIVSLFAGILSFLLGMRSPSVSSKAAPTTERRSFKSLLLMKAAPASDHLQKRRVIHHHPQLDPSLKLRNSYFEFVLVIATAMLSASLSSAILGSFMCTIVIVTRRFGGNPDNIATPLAGSLGDLLTLTIMGLLASSLTRFEGTILATVILVALIGACIACYLVTSRNAYVRELLSSGWIPLLMAMLISSGAGVVLDAFVQRFEGYALLAPVITGMPGASAAIFVSRTSTALHGGVPPKTDSAAARRRNGDAPPWYLRVIPHRFHKYVGYGPVEGWLVPTVLSIIGLVIMILFTIFVRGTGQLVFGVPFFLALTGANVLSIVGSLFISHVLTIALWLTDYDPDIYCLPFATSIIDVMTQLLLVMAYYIALAFGDKVSSAINT